MFRPIDKDYEGVDRAAVDLIFDAAYREADSALHAMESYFVAGDFSAIAVNEEGALPEKFKTVQDNIEALLGMQNMSAKQIEQIDRLAHRLSILSEWVKRKGANRQ